MQEKSFETVIISTFLFKKFDLPCFYQLVTGFHGNGNGISIPRFRFSATPCQLRAVNAIWLTARIQNSSILKWQRGKEKVCQVISLFSLWKGHSFMIVWAIDRWLSDTCKVQQRLSWLINLNLFSTLHKVPYLIAINWPVMVFLVLHLLSLWWALKWCRCLKETIWWSQ